LRPDNGEKAQEASTGIRRQSSKKDRKTTDYETTGSKTEGRIPKEVRSPKSDPPRRDKREARRVRLRDSAARASPKPEA
jgi:hypothetical protein